MALSKTRSKAMDPLQKYERTLRTMRKYFKFIGQDVFAANFRRGPSFYVIWAILLPMFSFPALDLAITSDLDKTSRIIQVCIVSGVAHVVIKYYLLKDLHSLRRIIDCLGDVFRKNSRPADKYYALCRRFARYNELILICGVASFCVLVVTILLFGLLEPLLHRKPVYCIYVPGVRNYTTSQFIALNAAIAVQSLTANSVIPAGDFFIYMILMNLTMLPLILSSQMDDMSARLERRQASVSEIKRRWMHYVVVHQEYNR